MAGPRRNATPGALEREFWSRAARGWERWEPVLLYGLARVDPALLRALRLEPGHRVVDFACGTGEPALTIAQWVAPRGRVLGLDIAGGMLRVARRRARRLGIENARFRIADISRLPDLGARFDRAVSRFGLMFADDVSLTLGRMRECLGAGGRLAVAVWGPAAENPGSTLRTEAVRPFLKQPPPDPEQVPHPLRLGRPGLLPRLMRRAGFAEVEVRAVKVCWVYPSLEDYVRVQIETTLSDTHRSLTGAERERLRARLRARFRRFEEGGVVRVPGLAWVASGRR